MLIDIPVDQITEAHLQSLVIDRVAENRQLEYKLALPTGQRADVKEFLKDVSALANAMGGDIIYGMKEGKNSTGNTVAVSLDGIAGVDANNVILRLEDIIRNGIKPRLIGVRIQSFDLSNGNTAFIVRAPRSWNAPHVVDYDNHWRFYVRGAAGSYPMDVTELRNAVMAADTMKQRLEEFRLDRLAKIEADPMLDPGGKIILHFQPLDSIRDDFEVDINNVRLQRNNLMLMQFDSSESETRLNFDGLLAYRANQLKLETNIKLGYIQIFRNGKIEEVDTRILRILEEKQLGNILIPSRRFEGMILNGVQKRLALLKTLDIKSPVIMHLSLIGVKGYIMVPEGKADPFGDYLDSLKETARENPIDRDNLLLRGVLMDDFQGVDDKNLFQYAAAKLRSSFGAIWNAAGFNGSKHYDEKGIWTGLIY